jgi:hypothetical protein
MDLLENVEKNTIDIDSFSLGFEIEQYSMP